MNARTVLESPSRGGWVQAGPHEHQPCGAGAPEAPHKESEKQPSAPPVASARARLEPGIPDPARPGQTIYTVRPEEREAILAALQAETRAQLKEPSHGTIASLPDPILRCP
jgi:hypothetical protein